MTTINPVANPERVLAAPPVPTSGTPLDDYRTMPVGPPYFEFEEGRLVEMIRPTARHNDVVLRLGNALWEFSKKQGLGRAFLDPVIFLPDGRGYIPDIGYLSRERLHLFHADDGRIHGSPDLAVEVTSSQPTRDRVEKFRIYYENAVPWYWIVDPDALALEEYRATPEGYVRVASVRPGEEFKPALLPGLVIRLSELVDEPVPPPAPPADDLPPAPGNAPGAPK